MKFTFTSSDTSFTCPMQCERCRSNSKTGARCKRRTCIGTGHCWAHLLSHKHLRIKASDLPGAGKGVFAVDRAVHTQAVVFGKGDLIIEYGGERVNKATVDARYGRWTAPYAIKNGSLRNVYEDAACHRGIGSIINHSKTKQNARLVGTGTHVAVYALRDIKNGLELLVNYGGDYKMNDPTHHTTR